MLRDKWYQMISSGKDYELTTIESINGTIFFQDLQLPMKKIRHFWLTASHYELPDRSPTNPEFIRRNGGMIYINYLKTIEQDNFETVIFSEGSMNPEWSETNGLFTDLTGSYRDQIYYCRGIAIPIIRIKRCGVRILTGNEDWKTASGDYSRHVLYLSDAKKTSSNNEQPMLKCSHFMSGTYQNVYENIGEDAVSHTTSASGTGGIMIRHVGSIGSEDHPTDNFLSWLAMQYTNGTPVSVVYPLEQEVIKSIKLSEEDLLKINEMDTSYYVVKARSEDLQTVELKCDF